jgi:hypothetical protein
MRSREEAKRRGLNAVRGIIFGAIAAALFWGLLFLAVFHRK